MNIYFCGDKEVTVAWLVFSIPVSEAGTESSRSYIGDKCFDTLHPV